MGNFYPPKQLFATFKSLLRSLAAGLTVAGVVCALQGLALAQAIPPFLQQDQPEFQEDVGEAFPGEPGQIEERGPLRSPFSDMELRFVFVVLDQLSYEEHPYYQITEDSGYENGKASSSYIFSTGIRRTDEDASTVEKIIHALPPFGIEGIRSLDLPFPRGLGFGLDSFVFSDYDTKAASGAGSVTAIATDTYIYQATLRFYFFNPMEPGINFFFGLGVGLLDGTMEAPFTSGTEYSSYSQSPVGSQRFGLESKGDDWGFRYEIILFKADKVTFESNNYDVAGNGPNPTEIDFSGTIVRMGIFLQF